MKVFDNKEIIHMYVFECGIVVDMDMSLEFNKNPTHQKIDRILNY